MALCAIGLFFGFPLQAAYVIVSFCVVVALSAFLSEWAGKVVMISAAVSLCAIALSCFLAGQFIDWSCDGNMYHKIAVAALSEGWNPFRGSVADAEAYSFVYPEGSSAVLWVDHYAQGLWEFSSCLYAFTHNMEASKCYTLLAMLALSFLVSGYLGVKGFKGWQACVAGLVAGANPIALAQFSTYYNDAFLVLSLGILIVGLIMIADSDALALRGIALLAVASAFVGCVGTKFTGLAYAGMFSLAFACLYIVFGVQRRNGFSFRELLKLGTFLVGTVLVSVLVIGFSPYVTNYIHEGHPFYPLFGEGAVDIMTGNSPSWITGMSSSIEKVITSLFSPVSNPYLGHESAEPLFKVPFTWDESELSWLRSCDLRMSGFGVLFSGSFILCLLVCPVMLVVLYRRCRLFFACFVAYLIATVGLMLGLSDSWWARYSGYAYYFVVFVLVFLFFDANSRKKAWYRRVSAFTSVTLLVCLLANSAFFFSYNIVPHWLDSREWYDTIDSLAEVTERDDVDLHIGVRGAQPGLLYTLRDWGIPFEYEGINPEGFVADGELQHLEYRFNPKSGNDGAE